MKKSLLLLFTLMSALMIHQANAQQTLTLKIIETHMDGETSISYDDGEFENDSIDKVNDDDLDMGWEGDDLNIMTTYTRFQNVTIPKGSVINSAKLVIYAHEDESAEAKVTIFGEAADNSVMFADNEAITDRTWTTASVSWDITENWTMWQQYESPDFSAVVQEIIDRPGWMSGNALTLFFQGEDQGASLLDNARDFESFENIEDPDDGGDGLHHPERIPTLVIEYTAPVVQNELVLTILETHKDGETSISYDDGEFENDSIDKVNDDDLDMGWEGDDLNIMTTYTRYQNVTIPQGAVIDSAVLVIYAHEDEDAEAKVTIFAEDIDDSPMFADNEAITDRTWTSASVKWDITEDWTMWQQYHTPNIASVIQAVVDRPGWKSGNALTLFLQGEDQGASLLDNARDFESFENIEDPDDGGDGLHHPERIPTLKIYYSVTTSAPKINLLTKEQPEILVYPNPVTNGRLNISSAIGQIAKVNIYNLNGSLIKNQVVNNSTAEFDVSDLQNGIYMLQIRERNKIVNKKIIINQ
jgi:hypothetical protein